MTKKWSSTASGDGKTKREASKAERQKEEKEIAAIMKEYNLDPLAEFEHYLCQKYGRK